MDSHKALGKHPWPNHIGLGGSAFTLPLGRVLLYLATYMPGLICHVGDSGVAGNKLRTSCRLDFLAVLVLQVHSRYFGAATPAGS